MQFVWATTLLPVFAVTLFGLSYGNELTTRNALCLATRNSIIIEAVYYLVYVAAQWARIHFLRPLIAYYRHNTDSGNHAQVQLYVALTGTFAVALHACFYVHERAGMAANMHCVQTQQKKHPTVLAFALARQISVALWFLCELYVTKLAKQHDARHTERRACWLAWPYVAGTYFVLSLVLVWITAHYDSGCSVWTSKSDSDNCEKITIQTVLPIVSDLLNLTGLTLMHMYVGYYAPNTEAKLAVTVAGDGLRGIVTNKFAVE